MLQNEQFFFFSLNLFLPYPLLFFISIHLVFFYFGYSISPNLLDKVKYELKNISSLMHKHLIIMISNSYAQICLAFIPPHNITISNIQSNQITVTWVSYNVGRVHRFQVGFRLSTSLPRTEKIKNTNLELNPNKSLSVTGLQNNSKYSIRARILEDGSQLVRSDCCPPLFVTTGLKFCIKKHYFKSQYNILSKKLNFCLTNNLFNVI